MLHSKQPLKIQYYYSNEASPHLMMTYVYKTSSTHHFLKVIPTLDIFSTAKKDFL